MRIFTIVFLALIPCLSFGAEQSEKETDQSLFMYKLGYFSGCAQSKIQRGMQADLAYHQCTCMVGIANTYLTKDEWLGFQKSASADASSAKVKTLMDAHKDEVVQCLQR
jgi:hypothetical protein